jgi:putative ABC transporter-associated repeat protein
MTSVVGVLGTRTAGALVVVAMVVVLAGGPVEAQDAQGESSPVEADEAVGRGRTVIGDGHVDVGPKFVDGEWTLMVRDDTVDPSVWRRLADVVLQATDAAVLQVPDDPTFAFLGPPGADVWVLPQVQQPGVLWPGWNTQDPEVATTVDREVTWTLRGVEGPGAFVLFFNRDFGQPETVFDSRQPYPQELGIEANTHAHGNWAFSTPGIYVLDVEMTTVTADGDELSAGGSLRIAVGDATDADDAFAAGAPASSDASTPTDGPRTDDPSGRRGDTGTAAGEEPGDGGSASPWPWLVVAAVSVLALAGSALLLIRRTRAGRAASVAEEPDPSASGGPREPDRQGQEEA